MAKLVLHIGSPKTGTTSIQKYLSLNEKKLLKKNWVVLNCKWGGVGLTAEKLRLDTLFQQKKKATQYVYSDEGIFNQICDTQEIEAIRNTVKKYVDDVSIIAYIRRQDSYGVSLKQQQIVLHKNIFGNSASALPDLDEKNRKRFNFYRILSRWGDVFGDSSIKIRPYEPDQLKDGDVVSDFLNITSIPEFDKPNIISNPSRGREITLINFAMQSIAISKKKKHVISKCLDSSDKLRASAGECEKFYSQFQKSNNRLNQRFNINDNPHIFNDDFSMYPIHNNSEWDNSTATQAINNILKGVKKLNHIDKKECESIQKAAKKLGKIDKDLANDLTLIANRIGSNN